VRRGELDEGDEKGQGTRETDADEDVEADLGVVHAWGYDCVADSSVFELVFVMVKGLLNRLNLYSAVATRST